MHCFEFYELFFFVSLFVFLIFVFSCFFFSYFKRFTHTLNAIFKMFNCFFFVSFPKLIDELCWIDRRTTNLYQNFHAHRRQILCVKWWKYKKRDIIRNTNAQQCQQIHEKSPSWISWLQKKYHYQRILCRFNKTIHSMRYNVPQHICSRT